MTWLDVDVTSAEERTARRKGAALLLVGLTIVAVITAAVVLFLDRHNDGRDQPHRGTQKATFASPDGRVEAAIYWYDRWFHAVTEVVLRPAGATAARDMVSVGCTEDEDGSIIVAVTVLADHVVIRNVRGDERSINFDPQTLQPETTLGSC